MPETPKLSPELLTLLEQAQRLEKWPLAQLISIYENQTTAGLDQRRQVAAYLEQRRALLPKSAYVVGLTGTPGSGKSSLLGELALALLKADPTLTVAVLAVDPSSTRTGGALLGDRTRLNVPRQEPRLFFRSQASGGDLGGLSRNTFQVLRLLCHLFDFVFIETVGIGQSELEIQHLGDHTFLVMQPLAGDQIQFMKAGIMEIPDSFIVNKCDEEQLAKRSYHALRSSLKWARILSEDSLEKTPIFLTSALKHLGVEELAEFILKLPQQHPPRQTFAQKERHFLEKSLSEEYGRFGLRAWRDWLAAQGEESVPRLYEDQEAVAREVVGRSLKPC